MMSFEFDDVMEVLKIVKESKDTELHIDTGDLKLSLYKGDVGNHAGSPVIFGRPEHSIQPESTPAPVPASSPAPASAPVASASAPAATEPTVSEPAQAPVAAATAEELQDENLHPIKANVTSVFYRSPSPDEPPFVEVGDSVEEDSVICLLEVMKCFRQVTAEVRGTVEKICAEDSDLVEEGTVIVLIRPE